MKKAISIGVVLVLILVNTIVCFADGDDIKVVLDGKQLNFDISPTSLEERTMVPVRAICEYLDATVEWTEEDQTIKLIKDDVVVNMKIDSVESSVYGIKVMLDVPATKINNRTLVPLRFISEAFGLNVIWEEDSNTVNLTRIQNFHYGKLYDDGNRLIYDGGLINGKRNGYGKMYDATGQIVDEGKWIDDRDTAIQEHIEGFDDLVLKEIHNVSKSEIMPLEDPEYVLNQSYKIIKFEVNHEETFKVMSALGKKIENSKYQVFHSRISYDNTPEIICVLKSSDKYDTLRAFNTNGINYDIDTDKLIEKLQKWDKEYGINILGVDFDWVDIKFNSLPGDLKKFAEEIYEFCPDSVDQGVGTIEALEKMIKEEQRVFLWWD